MMCANIYLAETKIVDGRPHSFYACMDMRNTENPNMRINSIFVVDAHIYLITDVGIYQWVSYNTPGVISVLEKWDFNGTEQQLFYKRIGNLPKRLQEKINAWAMNNG